MAAETDEKTPDRSGRPRSPSYPSISLEGALDVIAKTYAAEKRWALPELTVCKHAGFGSAGSGPARRAMAALSKFGLLEEKNGLFQFTDAGRKLTLMAPESPERRPLLKAAASRYDEILSAALKFPDGLPDDPSIERYLQLERSFTLAGAKQFVAILRSTLEFAGLLGDHSKPNDGRDAGASSTAESSAAVASHSSPPRSPPSEQVPSADSHLVGEQHVWQLGRGVVVRLSSNVQLSPKQYSLLVEYVELAKRSAELRDEE